LKGGNATTRSAKTKTNDALYLSKASGGTSPIGATTTHRTKTTHRTTHHRNLRENGEIFYLNVNTREWKETIEEEKKPTGGRIRKLNLRGGFNKLRKVMRV
jgi:hypothetical protein